MEKAYQIWRVFQDRFLMQAAAFVMLACTLLALIEVVRRYVFGVSFEWQQDAVTFFILSAIFLTFGISQRRGAHLNVTLLIAVLENFGPRMQRAAEYVKLLALVLSFLFMLAVVWWGIPEVLESRHYESRTDSLAFPMWPFLFALLIGFAFMIVSLFFQIYRGIQHLRGRTVLDEPVEAGEALH